jgi:electron transfer flavoprotein beta subunit
MSTAYQIVVCGSIVPDPLQTLEPVASPAGTSELHSAENWQYEP